MQRLVELSKIFSDNNRVKILALILRDKEVCVCEICDTLSLSQPLISRHLKQMKEVNILQTRKDKKWIHYSLISPTDTCLQAFIREIKKDTEPLEKLVICDAK